MIPLKKIKINPDNPREFTDLDIELMKRSITEFEKMLALRPIVVDETFMTLGGNRRRIALELLGYKEIPEEWIKIADDLTDDEKIRFIIADNVPFGQWNFAALTSPPFSNYPLDRWGLDIPPLGAAGDVPGMDDDGFTHDPDDDRQPKDLSHYVEPEFKIEITVENETEQQILYNELISRGYECKILTL